MPYLFLVAALALGGRTGWSQCPAIAADSTCGTILTITDAGTTISSTGQPPYYAGPEGGTFATGSLIGVINNSSLPISSLNLSSPYYIFYFIDGQGIDSFGVPGNSTDSSGYGGPNAYFTTIDATLQQGTVNFITPIAPGSSSFFSLANDLTQINANSCATAIDNAVGAPTTSYGGTQIQTSFTPNGGLSLSQAAEACGFSEWNWQQLITNLPAPSPFYDQFYVTNYTAPLPFNDPPPVGYSYQYKDGYNMVGLPIYYNLSGTPQNEALSTYETATTLAFSDSPADKCLAGGDPTVCSPVYPGGSTLAAPGQVLGFSTHLVGLIGTDLTATVVDTGIGFTYTDNFNGTSGGVSTLNNPHPVDPGSGTGGIKITGVTATTNRRFPQSLTVKAVNGAAAATLPPFKLVARTQMTANASGLAYSRATKTFTGTVTLKNVSGAALAGPFQVALLALSSGATLTNASGSFGGAPFLAVQSGSTLAAGASVTLPVRFSDPSLEAITFSPAIYTGGFN